MKKIVLLIVLASSLFVSACQQKEDNPKLGTQNMEAVDLGLFFKWATCNVGATKPEEYGDYFAWGEVTTKSSYTWGNYAWADGSADKLTKYCPADGLTFLGGGDDAAYKNLGDGWFIPDTNCWEQLKENCDWTWTTQNGVTGYLVTSKKNGNSIFLPATGCHFDDTSGDVGTYGYYWTSNLYSDKPSDSYYMYLIPNYRVEGAWPRYVGMTIRAVRAD